MGVEKYNFFSVFPFYLKSGHIDNRLAPLTEESTYRFFFFADDEVNKKAFSDLFRSNKCDNIKVRVRLIKSQVIDELIVEF
jgi:hypothetical protein